MLGLAAVVYSASLVHFCSAAAAEVDEHSDFELVACLVAAEVVLLDSGLEPVVLLAFVAGSYWPDFALVGNPEWHGP
ncbi:hypothetical protein AAC387_Pa04g1426 [Persea americana]